MDALTPDDNRRIDQVVELLRQSRSLLFITGAGLSADSGLPTYRGVGGLYDGCDPEEGVPIETLLSGEVLTARPELTWKYLLQIERACRGAADPLGRNFRASAGRIGRAFQRRCRACA